MSKTHKNNKQDIMIEVRASGIGGHLWWNRFGITYKDLERSDKPKPEALSDWLHACMGNFIDDLKFIEEHGAEEFERHSEEFNQRYKELNM